MITHQLLQGSPEWMAHRATHWNASDAPAIMGCSPYKTRTQLLHELHTGLAPEVDAATQRRFDDGHRFEALARPLAEEIIGMEVYPVTGSLGKLSASFDGLTMCETIGFEHKSLNAELRALLLDQCLGSELPMQYRVQMEQQCMVSGAERILFMASKWDGETLIEARDCWYTPDTELRAAITAGWSQFEIDLAAYVPPAVPVLVVAEPVQALPAVLVQVTGEIAVKDNFAAFETALRDFLEHRLIREPKTDQDFADLDVQIKAMKGAEAALESAETQMLAQVQTIDQAKKTKDMLAKLVRDNRLMAEKLLASEKERRRSEIVQKGRAAYEEHIAALTKETGGPWIVLPPPDFAGKVKGLRTIASMQGAVDDELARVKIVADESARKIRASLVCLKEDGSGYEFLFHDKLALIGKPLDDLKLLVKSRIDAHKAAELQKEEETRERIRKEEQDKAQREANEKMQRDMEESAKRMREEAEAAAAAAKPAEPAATPAPAPEAAPAANVVPLPTPQESAARILAARLPDFRPKTPPSLKLGQIGERLGFALTGDFLKTLGFEPAAREKSALLFHDADFPLILAALVAYIERVQAKFAA